MVFPLFLSLCICPTHLAAISLCQALIPIATCLDGPTRRLLTKVHFPTVMICICINQTANARLQRIVAEAMLAKAPGLATLGVAAVEQRLKAGSKRLRRQMWTLRVLLILSKCFAALP